MLDDKLFNKRLLGQLIQSNETLSNILAGLKGGDETVLKLQPSQELLDELKKHRPKFGVDFLTPKELDTIIESILVSATPKKGIAYFTSDEIKAFVKAATPIKGINYVDGVDGKPGKNGKNGKPGRNGKNGVSPSFEKIVDEVVKVTKDARSDKEKALEIVRLLESLIPKKHSEKDQRLRAAAIRGLFYGGGTVASSSTSSSGGGHTIKDEGVALTQRSNINFVGSGVTVTDDAGNDATLVTIPGKHVIQDEGVSENSRVNLNFVGTGVSVTDDAGNDRTIVNIPGSTPILFGEIASPNSGTIDDSNLIFGFDSEPDEIVVAGRCLRKRTGDAFDNPTNQWSWNAGSLQATLPYPVGTGNDIYGTNVFLL